MRKHLRWSLGILTGWLLLLSLTACDQVVTETPSPHSQNDAVLSVPTRTLGPIVSFTPRFTATPVPSITFTPSHTPSPTLTTVPPTVTSTPTPTLTPTISGVIRSVENVNLREGPGTTYDIVEIAPPGTDLGVLGIQTDAQDNVWYKIALTDEDGDIQTAWVIASLVDTDFEDIIGQEATPPPDTPAATTDPNITPSPTPTSEPNRVDILAYCHKEGVTPPSPSTTDNVYIQWWWWVLYDTDYMDEHLANANYEVRLDGELLDNWERYATDLMLKNDRYFIYWYYPIGQLDAGEHEIEFRLTWEEAVFDGVDNYGPGTTHETDEGNCTFTVTEP